ncbi:hypothetical protein [Pseudomonas fulva]|nr:hypothetical protein [Pseudomonas fulva]MBF8779250.1 hypothetical protein [Pseudomonas fulva]
MSADEPLQVLLVEPKADGGRLMTEGLDGFEGDVDQVLSLLAVEQGLSGRGLHLVRQLSRRARWLDGGRRAYVELAWQSQA